jgi:hypothetical protein
MNVAAFVGAVFVAQPLMLALGLTGYWLRLRRPMPGLALGVAALVLTGAALFVGLVTFVVASIAGGMVGIAAIIRPTAPVAARWLVLVGTIVWVVAIALLLLDASGII